MGTRMALVLAVVLGIVAAVGMRTWLQEQQEENLKKYTPVEIVIAKTRLKKGDIVPRSRMGVDFVPRSQVVSGMITKDEGLLYVNRMLNRDVEKGEPIFKSFLQVQQQKRQSAKSVVKEGYRACTIRVDQISGVGGLIRPGDYVDVIGTFETKEGTERKAKTMYLIQAVRVLAVDNRTMDVSVKRVGSSPYRSITLELKPFDSLRIVNAQSIGHIHLLLRSRGDVAPAESERNNAPITWDVTKELGRTVDHMTVTPAPSR